MTKKRRATGRNKPPKSRGHTKFVRCALSAKCIPKVRQNPPSAPGGLGRPRGEDAGGGRGGRGRRAGGYPGPWLCPWGGAGWPLLRFRELGGSFANSEQHRSEAFCPAPDADRCSRAATQDKAVKRYVVRNIVDAASLRDITEACAIEGAPPRIQPAAKHTHARLRECWEPRAGRGCAEGRTGLCQLAAAAVTRPRASADLPCRR